METKVCNKCGEEKDVTNYAIVKGYKRKDGTQKVRINSYCNLCKGKYGADWRNKHPEYHKKYKSENKDRVKEWKKKWDVKNYAHVLKYKRDKYPEMKEVIRGWNKKSGEKMREKLADCYVICTLTRGTRLTAADIRQLPELIELKRLQIINHRIIKNLEK